MQLKPIQEQVVVIVSALSGIGRESALRFAGRGAKLVVAMAEAAPVSVMSVKPGTINTPFFNNSAKKMDVKPKGPPPYYEPAVVADCVLYAAEHPVRDLFAGGAAKVMVATQMLAPKLVDAALARVGIPSSRTAEPQPGGTRGNLFALRTDDNRTEEDFSGQARRLSLYTWMKTHRR